jgi:hypothetical protein
MLEITGGAGKLTFFHQEKNSARNQRAFGNLQQRFL